MIVRKIVAAMLVTALMQVPFWVVYAAAPAPLVVAEGHLFFAAERNTLLVDIWPNRETVQVASKVDRQNLPISSAMTTAKMLLEKPDMSAIDSVRIEFSYVKNMDKYARQDFGSMVRHGHLLFQRKGSNLVLTENKPNSQASK
jgi:hypothetical protein